jgi:hypothetical protein
VVAVTGKPELHPSSILCFRRWRRTAGAASLSPSAESSRVSATRTLLQGLDEEDTLIAGAILAGIENPEAFRELLGPQHLSSRSTERAPAQFITFGRLVRLRAAVPTDILLIYKLDVDILEMQRYNPPGSSISRRWRMKAMRIGFTAPLPLKLSRRCARAALGHVPEPDGTCIFSVKTGAAGGAASGQLTSDEGVWLRATGCRFRPADAARRTGPSARRIAGARPGSGGRPRRRRSCRPNTSGRRGSAGS